MCFYVTLFSFDRSKQLAPLIVLLQTALQQPMLQADFFTWRHLYDSFGIDPHMLLESPAPSVDQLVKVAVLPPPLPSPP
jgi:hypothetical protein